MTAWCTITALANRPDRIEFGCVPYEYAIAKYQLTNGEWAEFLNAVGEEKVKTLKLWHKDMGTGVLGGISRVEYGEHVEFECVKGWEKKPVVYVRYVDVCRYCNWLQTGDTEKGAYDLSGEVPRRLVGAKYVIPTENEWYKAAYYDHGHYHTYPTGDELPRLDQANFERGDDFSKGPPDYLADVDEYADYPSPCGAVQMGGNAWEMIEDVSRDRQKRLQCHYRGGSFGYTETGLGKFNCDSASYNGRCYVFGVRLAYIENGFYPLKMPLKYGITTWCCRIKSKLKRCAGKVLFLKH